MFATFILFLTLTALWFYASFGAVERGIDWTMCLLFLGLLLIHKSILYLSSVSPAHILLLELLLKLSTFLLVHEEDLRARTIHLVPHKVHVSHLFKSCVLSLTPTAENRGVRDDRTHLSIASLSCSLCKIWLLHLLNGILSTSVLLGSGAT